jgi:putative ribosome biogenesis GTPase RsgA
MEIINNNKFKSKAMTSTPRVVCLLGESGAGKSYIGNAILNEKVFKTSAAKDLSMTRDIESK